VDDLGYAKKKELCISSVLQMHDQSSSSLQELSMHWKPAVALRTMLEKPTCMTTSLAKSSDHISGD